MFNSRKLNYRLGGKLGDLKMNKLEKRLAKLETKRAKIEKKIGKIKFRQLQKNMAAQVGNLIFS